MFAVVNVILRTASFLSVYVHFMLILNIMNYKEQASTRAIHCFYHYNENKVQNEARLTI